MALAANMHSLKPQAKVPHRGIMPPPHRGWKKAPLWLQLRGGIA